MRRRRLAPAGRRRIRQHVLAGEQARARGAARCDRLPDRPVLEIVLRVELVELCAGAPDAIADERTPGALCEALHERHRRRSVDDVVERVIRLHPLDEEARAAGLTAARLGAQCERQFREPPLRRVEGSEVGLRHAGRRHLRRQRLELGSDEVGLAQLARRDRAHPDTPVRLERDEAERREPAQRLAHRRARDAEPVGELFLAQHGAGCDPSPHDLVLEHAGDVVGLGGESAHRRSQSREL
jgi:hypothetical protein